jgi:UDP-N-acetyl-D-mannosaminuronic acid transferase (WecB/TagA/CpsF family)
MKNKLITFFGIRFYDYPFVELMNKINKGGYLVAPAASSLSKITEDKGHHKALKKSSIAILDSGFFCSLLFILKGISTKKNSGYSFMNNFLKYKYAKNKKLLCIDPTHKDSLINQSFLRKNKFTQVKSYIAPNYNPRDVKDVKLCKLVNLYKPKYILINIGGGVQEKLALYISQQSKHNPTSLCLGAAIGFYTGTQAPINSFFDNLFLGWFIRVIYNPIIFIPRVFYSLFLIKLFFKKEAFK